MTEENETKQVQIDPKEERMWGMFCHLGAMAALIGIPFGNILGPLVIWLIKKNEYPLVDQEGKKALNFQISVSIALVISFLLSFILIGIPLLIGIVIADIVLVIIAAVKINNGEPYKYPFSIEFIK